MQTRKEGLAAIFHIEKLILYSYEDDVLNILGLNQFLESLIVKS